MIDLAAERRDLLDQLEQHVDAEYQAGASMVSPTALRVYGVRVPVLQEIARDWQRAHKQATEEEVLGLVEALWGGPSREERMLALSLLGRYPRYVPRLTWAHLNRWRRGLDNWELTDHLGVYVLGAWALADRAARTGHLWELIDDEDLWSRRLALVATVWLNRGSQDAGFRDLSLALIDRVKAERHPMITKAVSWALREMIKQHPDQVAAYLEENRKQLAAHVVREVSNKLRTGLKSGK